MGFIPTAFIRNRLAWVFFVLAFILAALAQQQQGEHGAVIGIWLMALMLEFIRFLKNRDELPEDPFERKEYFVRAVGDVFAALFGAIAGVLLL